MDIKKVFVTAILTTMATVLISSLHGIAQDVIEINTHQTEQDLRIKENHGRAKKIFNELRAIRKDINKNHHEVLREVLDLHRKGSQK